LALLGIVAVGLLVYGVACAVGPVGRGKAREHVRVTVVALAIPGDRCAAVLHPVPTY
jgi:hypothetical protein